MDNLEEMDKFLEKYNFPRLNQEEIEHINRLITSTESETMTKNLLINKSTGPGEFYQTFREALVPILFNFLEEISSLSHSIVFLYFFALIAEERFIISPCYSL